jgi:hypothetical protein
VRSGDTKGKGTEVRNTKKKSDESLITKVSWKILNITHSAVPLCIKNRPGSDIHKILNYKRKSGRNMDGGLKVPFKSWNESRLNGLVLKVIDDNDDIFNNIEENYVKYVPFSPF